MLVCAYHYSCTRDRGCTVHPAFPRALHSERAGKLASLEQKPCCENENVCLNVFARSPCDEAIHSCFLAARWIASLTLAMTALGFGNCTSESVGWAKAPFAPCPPYQCKKKNGGLASLSPPYALCLIVIAIISCPGCCAAPSARSRASSTRYVFAAWCAADPGPIWLVGPGSAEQR